MIPLGIVTVDNFATTIARNTKLQSFTLFMNSTRLHETPFLECSVNSMPSFENLDPFRQSKTSYCIGIGLILGISSHGIQKDCLQRLPINHHAIKMVAANDAIEGYYSWAILSLTTILTSCSLLLLCSYQCWASSRRSSQTECMPGRPAH